MPVVLNRQVCGHLMCTNRELVSVLHFTLLRSHCRSGVWIPAAQVQSTPPRVTNDSKNVFFHVLAMINSAVMNIGVPGWMHETSARAWCTGKTQRDLVGREVGGVIGMGNTCKSMADSCQCMTKPTTIL